MKILLIKRSLIVGLCLFLFASCKSENIPTVENIQTHEVTDDLGRKLKLPKTVTRAISLAPSLTELVFSVGAGEKLVGVTTFCNYPEDAKKIQKIGDSLKPNIENIIALKPQVVFVSTASQLESFTQTLEKQNINVFVTNPNSLEDIYRGIEKMGEVFDEKTNADELVSNLKKRVSEVAEKTKNAKKIRVFLQLDKSPFTIGKKSFLTDLIEKAGGISVTNDVETPYFKISKEKALASNPAAIILSVSDDNNTASDIFKNSDAVKNKKVFKINADILSRPAPRIVDALEQIAKSLHPEKFEK
jgi:iron complex transport system substrate-binding protein